MIYLKTSFSKKTVSLLLNNLLWMSLRNTTLTISSIKLPIFHHSVEESPGGSCEPSGPKSGILCSAKGSEHYTSGTWIRFILDSHKLEVTKGPEGASQRQGQVGSSENDRMTDEGILS